jgi:pyruvate formate-lyase activating enzyme-like uncharacterized protein
MKNIRRTGYYSWRIGKLSKGCRLCVQGRKLVMFVTGLCSRNCYYCSLSNIKKNKDDVWANERRIKNYKEIVEEARANKAKGAGITGGDPFLRFNRTLKIIKLLKKNFGKRFHIHIYAPLRLITKQKLKKLERAGLDEIRVHPELFNKKLWYKIAWLRDYKFDSGVEIPAIPGKNKEAIELIRFINNKVDFININELEVSETNTDNLLKMGLGCKDSLSYAIKNSESTALGLLKYIKKNNIKINVHYCTAKLKDKVQLTNRVKLRASNVAKGFDKVTSDGILIRGAIYLPGLKPGFGYRKKLERISEKKKKEILSKLLKFKKIIKKNTKIKNIEIDKKKIRLITSTKNINFNKNKIKKIGLIPAILEEYPTYDATEVVVEFK